MILSPIREFKHIFHWPWLVVDALLTLVDIRRERNVRSRLAKTQVLPVGWLSTRNGRESINRPSIKSIDRQSVIISNDDQSIEEFTATTTITDLVCIEPGSVVSDDVCLVARLMTLTEPLEEVEKVKCDLRKFVGNNNGKIKFAKCRYPNEATWNNNNNIASHYLGKIAVEKPFFLLQQQQ